MKKIVSIFLIIISLFWFGCNADENEDPIVEDPKVLEDTAKWIIEKYDNMNVSEDFVLITEYQGTKLTWEIEENDYLDETGKYTQPKENVVLSAKIKIAFEDEKGSYGTEVEVELNLKGWGSLLNDIYKKLDAEMEKYYEVSSDIELLTEIDGATLKWESSNEKIITKDGKIKRGDSDQNATLKCDITFKGETTSKEYSVIVKKADHTFSEVEAFLREKYDGIEVTGDIEILTKLDQFGAELEWFIGYSEYLDENGKYTAPILDVESDVFINIIMNGSEKEIDLILTIKGWGTEMDVICEWVKSQIKNELTTSVNFPTTHMYYKSKITWTSDTPEVLSNTGTLNKKDTVDVNVKLSCLVEYQDETRTLEFDVFVPQKNDAEKNYEVRDWLDELFKDITEVSSDLDLPTTYEKYNSIIEWQSNSPGVVSPSGKYNKPLFDRNVQLVATTTVGKSTIKLTYEFKTYGDKPTNVWESVDMLLNYICLERIENQKYYTFGYQTEYAKNEVQNVGYLPFYDHENAQIKVDIIDKTHGHNRTGIIKTSTEWIVIHDTGSAHPTATAQAHANWLWSMTNDPNNTNSVSWHYTIDENEAIQHIPLDEVAYHAGDGSTTYPNTWSGGLGGGNRNGIGIETCVNYGSDYNKTMRRTAKVVAELLIDFNLGLDRVKQHYDFSGKNCPQTLREADRWQEFMTLVEIEYFAKTRLNGVTFKWTSLSPEIMDDTGKIINHPGNETTVRYKVEVSYNGETRTFEFSSILNELEK